MEKKKRVQHKPTDTTNPAKKSPVIIQLTDDDLDTVVGGSDNILAARCPPGG